jgi:poly-gamma-glutamate system protein
MAFAPSWPRPRVATTRPLGLLALLAALAVAAWVALEWLSQSPTHPRYPEMLEAARALQAASRGLYAEKAARGLLPPAGSDPNRTGMIGYEYTPLTTTVGDLAAKRTTTNPDFAAAEVRLLASLDLQPGTPVAVILSGSFVGGGIATIAALEALKLRPVLIVSLGASMWGATNPEFNLLDMLTLLAREGVVHTRPIATVPGGEGAIASGMEPEVVEMLYRSAARAGVPMVEQASFPALIDDLEARIAAAGSARAGSPSLSPTA